MRRLALAGLLGVLGCDGAMAGTNGPRIEACTLLDAERVATVLEVQGAVEAKTDALEVFGNVESQCAWQVEGRNRVTLTLIPDVGARAFRRLKVRADSMSRAGPRLAEHAAVVNTDDVRGNYAVAQSDGSIVWNVNDRLVTLNVLNADGSAAKAETRRTLAETIAAKL